MSASEERYLRIKNPLIRAGVGTLIFFKRKSRVNRARIALCSTTLTLVPLAIAFLVK